MSAAKKLSVAERIRAIATEARIPLADLEWISFVEFSARVAAARAALS